MTREEVDAYEGRRAKMVRADGVIMVGVIRRDSLARFAIIGNFGHLIQYAHVAHIELASEDTPFTD